MSKINIKKLNELKQFACDNEHFPRIFGIKHRQGRYCLPNCYHPDDVKDITYLDTYNNYVNYKAAKRVIISLYNPVVKNFNYHRRELLAVRYRTYTTTKIRAFYNKLKIPVFCFKDAHTGCATALIFVTHRSRRGTVTGIGGHNILVQLEELLPKDHMTDIHTFQTGKVVCMTQAVVRKFKLFLDSLTLKTNSLILHGEDLYVLDEARVEAKKVVKYLEKLHFDKGNGKLHCHTIKSFRMIFKDPVYRLALEEFIAGALSDKNIFDTGRIPKDEKTGKYLNIQEHAFLISRSSLESHMMNRVDVYDSRTLDEKIFRILKHLGVLKRVWSNRECKYKVLNNSKDPRKMGYAVRFNKIDYLTKKHKHLHRKRRLKKALILDRRRNSYTAMSKQVFTPNKSFYDTDFRLYNILNRCLISYNKYSVKDNLDAKYKAIRYLIYRLKPLSANPIRLIQLLLKNTKYSKLIRLDIIGKVLRTFYYSRNAIGLDVSQYKNKYVQIGMLGALANGAMSTLFYTGEDKSLPNTQAMYESMKYNQMSTNAELESRFTHRRPYNANAVYLIKDLFGWSEFKLKKILGKVLTGKSTKFYEQFLLRPFLDSMSLFTNINGKLYDHDLANSSKESTLRGYLDSFKAAFERGLFGFYRHYSLKEAKLNAGYDEIDFELEAISSKEEMKLLNLVTDSKPITLEEITCYKQTNKKIDNSIETIMQGKLSENLSTIFDSTQAALFNHNKRITSNI